MPHLIESALYHAVGRVVTRWGYIDALLATLCSTLFEDLGGHTSAKKPPHPLSKRLEYIGKCFRNKPSIAEYAELMGLVCKTIKDIDTHRAFLVHGCMTEYHSVQQIFTFTKMDTKTDNSGYEQRSMDLSLNDLHQVAEASKQVISALSEMNKHLNSIPNANQHQQ
jgi:hypothetical protein